MPLALLGPDRSGRNMPALAVMPEQFELLGRQGTKDLRASAIVDAGKLDGIGRCGHGVVPSSAWIESVIVPPRLLRILRIE